MYPIPPSHQETVSCVTRTLVVLEDAVQLVITHQCPYVGRYVTVYNYRNNPKRYSWYSDDAILELCEVQVFGCQVGKYGDGNCNSPCPPACYGGNCNSTTGVCFYCLTGKYDIYCNSDCPSNCKNSLCTLDAGACLDCVPQTYGVRCEHACSANCLNSLCEKVNGFCYDCIPGRYGNACDQNCPGNCKDMLCEKSTGNCIECIPGKYGITCDQNCPANCMDMLCEKSTGNCIGCIPGKYGTNCDQNCQGNCKDMLCDRDTGSCEACLQGTFGEKCLQRCHCKTPGCNHQTGVCLIPGCQAGYSGASCSQVCINTRFGENCSSVCHCDTPGCDSVSGRCIVPGCAAGWKEETCSKSCSEGEFEKGCNMLCHCAEPGCNKENGICKNPNKGCLAGWNGTTCSQECPESTFGEDCLFLCHCKTPGCSRFNGTCTSSDGCIDGYVGITCSTECKPGFFGANCSKQCHCKDDGCNLMTGNCSPSGCVPGWRGSTCSESCGTGRFGEACSLICPVTCKDFVCHHETGHCLDCYPGKYGVVCGANCPDTCTDNICSKDDGHCLTDADSNLNLIAVMAVGYGLFLAALIAIAVLIYHLRKRQSRMKSSDKEKEQSVPDTGYTSITHRQEETPHVYEMVFTYPTKKGIIVCFKIPAAMSEYPNFNIELPDFLSDDPEFSSSGDDELSTIDVLCLASTNASSRNGKDYEEKLKQPAIADMPPPGTPCSTSSGKVKRFKPMAQEDVDKILEAREAPSTKKSTLWGLNIFQATPKSASEESEPAIYHRNSLISIRAALNRHLASCNRNIDIVRDKEFKRANGVLDRLLKERMRSGQSKPTQHKTIIEGADLIKISTYLEGAVVSPIILRECVWHHLSLNFITRGMEFHHQLNTDSFEFHTDDSGEYVTIKHETKQKNLQGGLSSSECSSGKRMYATGTNDCPIRMLKLLLEKTDKSATSLFNQYNRDALGNPGVAIQIRMTTKNILLERCVILILYFMLNAVRSENNVARSKQAEQSSDYFEHVASRGVDDCLQTNLESNCCAHTLNGFQKAWWRVDLGELVTINRIKIYYRDNNQERLAGYQLYVSNTTTSPRDGVLCYEDTSSTRRAVQLVVTHMCPYIGQYVTVYNYRNNTPRYSWYSDEAFLELCEVQVFGCQVGRYGEGNCNNQCPRNCYRGNCDSTTGACFYCITGKYGNTCDQDCPASCKDMLCGKNTGNCTDCIPRKYGIRCEHDCSTNCQDRLCDKDSGNCYVCIPGKYGNVCDQNCPENCKDCEKKTGNCIGLEGTLQPRAFLVRVCAKWQNNMAVVKVIDLGVSEVSRKWIVWDHRTSRKVSVGIQSKRCFLTTFETALKCDMRKGGS
ncbi:uncharacterized protein LOC117326606 [Pecten maximus]|uniref:uncharacterized protein LOC117326606 n=1 Tax=Pecten maximus TaxID=6579 RepID=UPI001458DF40|nr:uncharacterized protein LOC117326606 [Pecten maximus]